MLLEQHIVSDAHSGVLEFLSAGLVDGSCYGECVGPRKANAQGRKRWARFLVNHAEGLFRRNCLTRAGSAHQAARTRTCSHRSWVFSQFSAPAGRHGFRSIHFGFLCDQSYHKKLKYKGNLAWSAGFEPATIGLEIRCSIQLSYDQMATPLVSMWTSRL